MSIKKEDHNSSKIKAKMQRLVICTSFTESFHFAINLFVIEIGHVLLRSKLKLNLYFK